MNTVRIVIQTDDLPRKVSYKDINGEETDIPVVDSLVKNLLIGLKEIGSGNTICTIEREENESVL